MAIRPILLIPDPVLRQISKPVTAVTKDIRALADDMLETMYDVPGQPDVKEVVVSDKVITNGEAPLVVYESTAQRG